MTEFEDFYLCKWIPPSPREKRLVELKEELGITYDMCIQMGRGRSTRKSLLKDKMGRLREDIRVLKHDIEMEKQR